MLRDNGSVVQLEARGIVDGHYYDRTIAADQLAGLVREVAGGAIGEGLLPGLDLAGVDLVPASRLGHRFLALHRLQSHLALRTGLCFLRPLDISHSSLGSNHCLQFRSRTFA